MKKRAEGKKQDKHGKSTRANPQQEKSPEPKKAEAEANPRPQFHEMKEERLGGAYSAWRSQLPTPQNHQQTQQQGVLELSYQFLDSF